AVPQSSGIIIKEERSVAPQNASAKDDPPPASRILPGWSGPAETRTAATGYRRRRAAPPPPPEGFSARHWRQHPALLRVGAEPRERVRHCRVPGDDGGESRGAARQLLDEDRVGPRVEPEASQLLRYGGAEETELGERRDELRRVGPRTIEFLAHGGHALVHELADGEHHLASLAGLALARGEGAEALAVSVHELSRDERPLDLVRALADDHERRVAVVALDGTIGARAARAVQPERRHGQLLCRLRREELRHASLEIATLG